MGLPLSGDLSRVKEGVSPYLVRRYKKQLVNGCGVTECGYDMRMALSNVLFFEPLINGIYDQWKNTDEGIYGEQTVEGTDIAPQLDQAFAAGTPDIMSITIGANDLRWQQFVRDCYVWRCGSSWDEARAEVYLLDLRWELYRTLLSVWERSAGGEMPQVLLTGYFDPLQGQTCAAVPNITQSESTWLTAKVAALNQVIREAAASATFATYVPVDFSGHGLCAADSWVQGVQDPAPVHPTARGQAAIAQAVSAAVRQ